MVRRFGTQCCIHDLGLQKVVVAEVFRSFFRYTIDLMKHNVFCVAMNVIYAVSVTDEIS